MTEGEIRKVDKDAKKLTIKHGEIKSLDMPPMTMVFAVADPAMLEGLSPGMAVRVRVERREGGLVVTRIEPVRP
jgi:Cu/Ag efflux protein CusF